MFLSLVFFLSLGFVQYARAATVDADNLRQMFDKYGAPSEWNWLKSRVDDNAIAWMETYIMRSYLIMYQATKDKRYLDEFIGHADTVLDRRDNVRGVTDYRGLSLPAWRVGKWTDYKEFYIYAAQTGLTAAALAEFAVVVNKDPNLTGYKPKADEYLQAAKDAVDVLDMRNQPQYMDVNSRWIEEGNTMYLDRPVNKNLAVGSAYLAIYEASGDKTYLERGIKVANYFKKYLTINPSSNSYYWEYYPTRDKWDGVIEDTNHANPALQFINLAYDTGIFNETDMQRFANTASKVLIKSDGTIANRLNGSGTANQQGQIANWLIFEPWAPSLFDVAYSKLAGRSSVNPPELLGVALLNYVFAQNNISINEPSDQVPNPSPKPNPAPTPGPEGNLIENGTFSAGTTGWVNKGNTAVVETGADSNKYLANTYNFRFYQDLNLEPGTYKLNAKTRKGTAQKGARIVVRYFYQDGSDSFDTFKYQNSGTGWESMPEMTLEVPSTATTTRIYLSAIPGADGTQHFDDITLVPAEDTSAPNTPAPDTEAPHAAITAPAGGSALKDTVTMEVDAGDNVGVTQVTLAYAAGAQGSWKTIGKANLVSGNETEGTWQLVWDVSGIQNGTYYVRATTTDEAGNTSTSEPVACEINNIKNLIVNGDFSAGTSGWVNKNNTAEINTDSNGNKYLTNTYNFRFYQDLNLEPGVYKLNAKTRKGTAEKGARVVVRYFHRNGSDSFDTFKYQNSGTGWESMPEMTLEVPSTATTTRIYLSAVPGDSGTQHFDDITLTAR